MLISQAVVEIPQIYGLHVAPLEVAEIHIHVEVAGIEDVEVVVYQYNRLVVCRSFDESRNRRLIATSRLLVCWTS